MSSLFLPPGLPTFRLQTRQGTSVAMTRGQPAIPTTLPVVVLIDEGTGSGGELLAAALREHGRARLVGMR